MKLRFLIASGPTREPLDPVRFLSNYSTGAMGKHLAAEAKKRGHRVAWLCCPKDAQTARELYAKLRRLLPKSDVLVMAAAVCDARPRFFSRSKIKKERLSSIALVKNPDVVAALAKKKKKRQVFVGFALESERFLENARKKIDSKKLDLLIIQPVSTKKTPFGDKTIEAALLKAGDRRLSFDRIPKRRLAARVVSEAERLFVTKKSVF